MLSFKNPKNRLGGIKEIIFLHEFPHERWFASGIHGELTPTQAVSAAADSSGAAASVESSARCYATDDQTNDSALVARIVIVFACSSRAAAATANLQTRALLPSWSMKRTAATDRVSLEEFCCCHHFRWLPVTLPLRWRDAEAAGSETARIFFIIFYVAYSCRPARRHKCKLRKHRRTLYVRYNFLLKVQ